MHLKGALHADQGDRPLDVKVRREKSHRRPVRSGSGANDRRRLEGTVRARRAFGDEAPDTADHAFDAAQLTFADEQPNRPWRVDGVECVTEARAVVGNASRASGSPAFERAHLLRALRLASLRFSAGSTCRVVRRFGARRVLAYQYVAQALA